MWLTQLIQKQRTLYILLFSLFGALLLYFTVINLFFFNRLQHNRLENDISTAQIIENKFRRFLGGNADTLKAISGSKVFHSYLQSPTAQNSAALQEYLLFAAATDPYVMQLRFLNARGEERLRIDRDAYAKRPYPLPADKLQNKAHRDYFQLAKEKAPNEVYFSNLDLNIEHKKVELPYKPTVRVMLPVYKQGRFQGVLISNLFMKEFMHTLFQSSSYNMLLADREGEILHHYDPKQSWTRYDQSLPKLDGLYPRAREILQSELFIGDTLISKRLKVQTNNRLYLIMELNTLYTDAQTDILLKHNAAFALVLFLLSSLLALLIKRLDLSLITVKQSNSLLQAEVKKQISQLRQKEQLLIQQSKLASMAEMMSSIAHQWRQPLNTLMIYKNLIVDDYTEGSLSKEKLLEFDGKMDTILHSLSKTINDFRRFFVPSKKQETFRLDETIASVHEIVLPLLQERFIQLRINGTGTPVYVTGYPNEFRQVLLTLIKNAQEAIERQLANHEIVQGVITLTLSRENGSVYLRVEDNGGGIAEDIIDKIYEPYFTTKFEAQGTGLGLYMAKMLVEKSMHGELSVKNATAGAIFSIKLTAAPSPQGSSL